MVSSTESMAFTTSSKLTQSIHLPVGQDGEGEYSAATKGCFDVIDTATPLVLTEIAQQSERDSGASAYHIADYGTADGGTSLGLLSKMVNAVRERGSKDKEVVLHYEDQATNEWQVCVCIRFNIEKSVIFRINIATLKKNLLKKKKLFHLTWRIECIQSRFRDQKCRRCLWQDHRNAI